MATVYVSWVRFGVGVRDDGAQNCVVSTVKTETITTSGSNAQSGAAPSGANGAIVSCDSSAHYIAFQRGESNPDASGTARMYLGGLKDTAFAGFEGGEKIAAITA